MAGMYQESSLGAFVALYEVSSMEARHQCDTQIPVTVRFTNKSVMSSGGFGCVCSNTTGVLMALVFNPLCFSFAKINPSTVIIDQSSSVGFNPVPPCFFPFCARQQ
jgi:hypothetical protein